MNTLFYKFKHRIQSDADGDGRCGDGGRCGRHDRSGHGGRRGEPLPGIGGHSYGHPYSGPVGAVVMLLLAGINRCKDLCQGETLCGACQDACPVNIDIPRMLLALRMRVLK